MPHSIMRVDIAGRDVSRYLRFVRAIVIHDMSRTVGYIDDVFRLLLRKEGVNFKTTAEFEIVRIIKEKACYLALNPQKEETGATETETYQYILPDGSTLDVSGVTF